MKMKMPGRVRGLTWLCALLYFSSYILRGNFAAMLVKICNDLGQPKTALAVVVTALTICYGGGQLISGAIGDKIAPRHMLICGIGIASICNVAMYFCTSIPAMAIVWAVNGFANSMLWAPLVRLYSINFTEEQYSYGMIRVMFASASSKVALYLLCPALLLFLPWRAVTLSIGVFGLVVCALFALLVKRFSLPDGEVAEEQGTTERVPAARLPLPKIAWIPIVLIIAAILLQGILRDAMATWTPYYLYEVFHITEEKAIFATSALAVFDVMSFALYNIINSKLFHDEVLCSAALFALSAAAAVGLWLLGILTPVMALSLVCLALIESCMHGVNLMLLALAPRRLVKSGHVSLFTGLFDAFSYIGGAISAYGFAVTAENYGWNVTTLIWIATGALGAVVCFVAFPLWRRFRRTYADVPLAAVEPQAPQGADDPAADDLPAEKT